MDQWVPEKDFIAADVIRWTEGIFERGRRRNAKSVRIGERLISAEVIERGKDGWVRLLVRACAITKNELAGKTILPLKTGETLRRGIKTILRGKPERLLWRDESARDVVLASNAAKSRFITDEESG